MKILRLFTIILMLMNSTVLLGNGTGYDVKIKDVQAIAGEVVDIELEITNEGEFVAFGLDIPLPEGFGLVTESFALTPSRIDGHIFSANILPGTNTLRIFVFNQEETKAFLGKEGVIATFQLLTPEEPGTYELDIVDPVLSDADAESILLNDPNPSFSIGLSGNEIHLPNTEVNINQNVTIDIEISNYQEFTAFQVDIKLPEGFTPVSNTLGKYAELNYDRAVEDDHQIETALIGDDVLRIYSFSQTNTLFKGSKGVVASFTVNAAPDAGGDFYLTFEEAIISDVDGDNIISMDPDPGKVTVFDHNILLIEPVTALTNETITIELEIDNSMPFTAFETEIILDDELTLVTGTFAINDARLADHEYSFEPFEDGYKLIVYSMSNSDMVGFEGAVATFDVLLPSFEGVFNIQLENAIIANKEEQNILTDVIHGVITVNLEVDLIIDDAFACGGHDVIVDLHLNNSTEAVAFQADIHIPEGFEFIKAELNANRVVDHELDATFDEETGIVKLIAYSISNAAFVDTKGVIAHIYLDAVEVVPGVEYEVGIDNAIVSDKDANDILKGIEGGVIVFSEEPVLAFEFNGVLAVTDSEFEYNANEEVVVTLATVHAGVAPFHIVYELNGVETVITGAVEGTELFKGKLPYGEHELVVTAIVDANGCAVVTPEEFYRATINVVLTEVETLAELRAMPHGMSYIYVGDAVIVAMDGFRNRKFIQDETAAILIDDQPGMITTEYELYDVITNVAGTINVFRNLVQYQPLANTAEADENTPVDPTLFAIDEVTPDDQAKLIRFEGVTFEGITDGQVFANGRNYVITDGVVTYTLRTDFWNVDYIGEEIPHGPVNVNGVVLQFWDNLQIVPRFAADIEVFKEVTFNVDLGPAIEYENLLGFDPAVHNIYITGSLLGWAEPGTNDEQIMVKTGDDPIVYSKTFYLPAGEYAYKYFSDLIGSGWNGGEWIGGDDRIVTIVNDTIINDMFAYRDNEVNVPEIDVATIKLYPNPASSILTIESDSQIMEIRVVDMVGRMVYSTRVQDNSYTMDVHGFRNGIYFVQVITANGFITERVQITK